MSSASPVISVEARCCQPPPAAAECLQTGHLASQADNNRKDQMNISPESSPNSPAAGASRLPRASSLTDELTQLKKQLLHAEVRHARARAAVSGAEADVKVLNARLRALTK